MSEQHLTVSDLMTAAACPRLYFLHRRADGPSVLFEASRSFSLGRLFHGWVAQAIREACGRGGLAQELRRRKSQEAARELLVDFLYRHAFFPWLRGGSAAKAPGEIVLLWDSLGEVASFLGDFLANAISAGQPTSRVLLSTESELLHRFRVDGLPVSLRGRPDAVVRDPRDGRVTVLEFKTRPDRSPEADLIQIAAYTWLLERKQGIQAEGALAYFTPRLELSRFPRVDLDRAVGQLIPAMVRRIRTWLETDPAHAAALPPAADPHLCTICPHHPPCPQRFPPQPMTAPLPSGLASGGPGRSRRRAPEPPPRETAGQARPSPDPLGERLVAVLTTFRCPAELLGREVGPTFVRYRLRPAPGVTVAAMRSRQEDLKVQLGLDAVPLVQAGPGYVSVDIQREDREFLTISGILERPDLPGQGGGLVIPLGVAVDGRLVSADLADPNTCHFLVAGTPGSGKSEFLKAVAASIIRRHDPSAVNLLLIDPKQVTFPPFSGFPHVRGDVATGPDQALGVVTALGEEMDRRYARFAQAGAQDLTGYRAQGHAELPHLVVLFDEFGDCMLRDQKTGKALEASVVRLGQMARAAGIHLILATQKPVVRVVTGLIKGNLPGRIAFRVASRTDSQVILDTDDAAYLLGKGDMIVQWAGTSLRLQAPYLPDTDLPLLAASGRSGKS